MKCIVVVIFLAFSVVSAQKNDNDYYQLYKGGKEYIKPVRYILLDGDSRKVVNGNPREISFYIGNEIFTHNPARHKRDTCLIVIMNKIKLKTIKELFEDEYKEHKQKTQLENITAPPPLNHYNLKVFIIEKINPEKIIEYEVDWIYSIP